MRPGVLPSPLNQPHTLSSGLQSSHEGRCNNDAQVLGPYHSSSSSRACVLCCCTHVGHRALLIARLPGACLMTSALAVKVKPIPHRCLWDRGQTSPGGSFSPDERLRVIWPSAVFNSSSCSRTGVALLDFKCPFPTSQSHTHPRVT